jgi:hypothetical protein
MQKSKKNAVGLVGACGLLGGASNWVNKGLTVKIAVFCLLATIRNNDSKIGLYGLKSGCWRDRLLKPLAVTATYRLIHCNAFFILLKAVS